jgi:hypothetical protein
MVFVQPQRGAARPTLGNTLGQNLKQGFQQQFNPAVQQEYQRGRIQEALGGLQNLPANASPTDVLTSLISATAGIPGAERYVGPLYDSLMRARQSENYANAGKGGQRSGQGQPIQPGQIGAQGQQNPIVAGGQPNNQPNPIAQPQGQAYQGQGGEIPVTPGLGTLDIPTMQQIAMDRALAKNDPNAYAQEFQQLQRENEEARIQQTQPGTTQQLETVRQGDILQRDNQLRGFVASKLPGANAEDLNDFMLIGQRHESLKNKPAEWLDATQKDFKAMKNELDALESSFNPGIFSNLLRGGKYREESLDRLTPIVQNLKKYGKEDYARNQLSNMYLSPTEVEERVNPLSKESQSKISEIPEAPYKNINNFPVVGPLGILGEVGKRIIGEKPPKDQKTYDELKESNPKLIDTYNNKLADFLRDNLKEGDSTLVWRDKLGKEKHVDWRQYNDALNMAEQNGLKLSPRQQAERAELTRAPIQSLPDLFTEWGRWVEYLRGNK